MIKIVSEETTQQPVPFKTIPLGSVFQFEDGFKYYIKTLGVETGCDLGNCLSLECGRFNYAAPDEDVYLLDATLTVRRK